MIRFFIVRCLKVLSVRGFVGTFATVFDTKVKLFLRAGKLFRSISSIAYGKFVNDLEIQAMRIVGVEFARQNHRELVMFDCGANVGSWAIQLASVGFRVVAIEPSSENFPILLRQLSINPELQIEPYKLAVGASNSFVRLSTGFGSSNCVEGYSLFDDESVVVGEKVRIVTLDTIAKLVGAPPVAVKIDVEGFYKSVLEGAVGLIEDKQVAFWVIEMDLRSEEEFETNLNIILMMQRNGYVVLGGSMRHFFIVDRHNFSSTDIIDVCFCLSEYLDLVGIES